MNHRLPAAVFLTAAAFSAAAALVGGVRESAQCGAVALLILAGWAAARGRGAARWSLPAGLAFLALGAVLQTRGYGQPGALTAFGNAEINRDRTVAAALLLASSAFLIALRSLPRHPPSRDRGHAALLVTAIPAVLALTGTAGDIDTAAQILPLIVGTAPAWAAVMAAAAAAGMAILRADGRFLLPAGALLLAGSAVLTLASLTGAWLHRWNAEHPPGTRSAVVVIVGSRDATATITRYGTPAPALTETGTRTTTEATAVTILSGPDPGSAAAALVALLGPTLLTAGAVSAAHPAEDR